eukprot:TRINITY_DN36004_c0_g1_i3.p1 TRINITY_DN36004_c0_g1~~TRINITY_DN36004_c0_g1_i3.p1  ORF type:complete len:228 (+),score=23.56 TRINITY_DN36004_c0_g1_i3:66-749(+)
MASLCRLSSIYRAERIRPTLYVGSRLGRFCTAQGTTVTPEKVEERDLRTSWILGTLPLRNFLRCARLQPLNIVFKKQAWDSEGFADGCTAAFRRVNALLETKEYDGLQSLVGQPLRDAMSMSMEGVFGKQEVIDVKPLGVFTSSMWRDENGHLALWVTQVLRAQEAYTSECGGRCWHVDRLHRWTFKRVLLNDHEEEVSDWLLVAVDRPRWSHPGLAGTSSSGGGSD